MRPLPTELSRPRALLAGALCVAALWTGCRANPDGENGSSDGITDEQLETEVPDALREIIEVIRDGDCEVIRSRVVGLDDDHTCMEYVNRVHGRSLEIVSFAEIRRDGRDPSSAIIDASVIESGQPRDHQYRLSLRGDEWILVLE